MGDFMKKKLILFLVSGTSALSIVGCGNAEFSQGKAYTIETDDIKCEITVNGAKKTNLLNDFSEEMAEDQEIVNLDCDFKIIESDTPYLGSIDLWNYIRVCDEEGNEITPFEYALPGDDTSVIILEETGKKYACTIPYAVDKNERFFNVDIYQNTEYSNTIKLDIK